MLHLSSSLKRAPSEKLLVRRGQSRFKSEIPPLVNNYLEISSQEPTVAILKLTLMSTVPVAIFSPYKSLAEDIRRGYCLYMFLIKSLGKLLLISHVFYE